MFYGVYTHVYRCSLFCSCFFFFLRPKITPHVSRPVVVSVWLCLKIPLSYLHVGKTFSPGAASQTGGEAASTPWASASRVGRGRWSAAPSRAPCLDFPVASKRFLLARAFLQTASLLPGLAASVGRCFARLENGDLVPQVVLRRLSPPRTPVGRPPAASCGPVCSFLQFPSLAPPPHCVLPSPRRGICQPGESARGHPNAAHSTWPLSDRGRSVFVASSGRTGQA